MFAVTEMKAYDLATKKLKDKLRHEIKNKLKDMSQADKLKQSYLNTITVSVTI